MDMTGKDMVINRKDMARKNLQSLKQVKVPSQKQMKLLNSCESLPRKMAWLFKKIIPI